MPETARVVSFRVREDVTLKSIIQFVDATQGFDGSDFWGKLIQPDVYSVSLYFFSLLGPHKGQVLLKAKRILDRGLHGFRQWPHKEESN
jgi:hypothetical protein